MEKIGTMVKLSARAWEEFSLLVDTYEKLVFSICYKITGDFADDCTCRICHVYGIGILGVDV